MNYQDHAAQAAARHYVRQVRYMAFKRVMLDVVWPCVAIALVIYLNWK